jgi:hypothetical protein
MSRGLRNNNPGNIRQNSDNFLGEIKPSADPSFKQFESIEYGYRAIFVTLNTYQKKYGLSTIRAMISRWAPPKDNNDTEAYIRAVSSESGVPENSRITSTNKDVMVPIVAAMSRVENGVEANITEVQRGWDLFMQ